MLMKKISVDGNGREAPEVMLGNMPAIVYEMDAEAEGIRGVRHSHGELQIVVVSKGSIRFEVEGEDFDLETGEGLFINTGCEHAAFPLAGGPCTYTCLKFTSQAVSFGDYTLTGRYVTPVINGGEAGSFRLDQRATESAVEAARRIEQHLEESSFCAELEIIRELIHLWIEVYRCSGRKEELLPGGSYSEKTRIMTMCDYIHKNYAEKISLNDIANSAFVSKGECCRIFKRVLQLSPFQYLVRYRLKLSVQMLSETEYSIAQIAQQVGFCSSSYYTKCFRKEYNCAPHRYRTEL